MSNGHVGTNCVVVTGFNGIPFPLTKPLHYVNPFFRRKWYSCKKIVPFLAKRLLFLAAMVGSGSHTGNGCNGHSRSIKTAIGANLWC